MLRVVSDKFRNFFSNGHERTLIAKKNIIISLLFRGLTILCSFFLIPITIHYINPTQYGIWLTLSSIVSWFNFFDLGLGNGLKNKLAEENALGGKDNIKVYVSTTYAVISIISFGLFIVFIIANHFLNWGAILNVTNAGDYNFSLLALIVFASFCLLLIFQILFSILTALHEISKVAVVNAISQILCLILIVILTKIAKPSLIYLVAIFSGVPVLLLFISNIYFFSGKYRNFAPKFKFVNLKHAKELLTTGSSFFFIQLGSLLLFQTDNIVTTQLFGPNEVTVFNIAYKLFSAIIMVFTIIMNPFWPAFTDAYAKGDITWIKTIFKKLYKYCFYFAVVSILIVIFSPVIYLKWLGKNIQIPIGLSLTMAIYAIGVCWMTIHNFFINAISKVKLQLYLYAVTTLINIPIAIFLGKAIGIQGIVISNIIVVAIMGVAFYIQCKKVINNTATGLWNK